LRSNIKLHLMLILLMTAVFIHSADDESYSAGASMVQDKNVKILWRENFYNAELQDTMSMIVMDTSYCRTISDPEKAAIAFVATFVGNDCWWDGQYTNDRSNLKCKVLTELNLGYQCSEIHLEFLRQWFSEDAKALKRLEDCPTTPFTATVQETFDSIRIAVEGQFIVVNFSVTGFNIREDLEWHRTEEITFRNAGSKLIIEKETKFD
jgi:hypothetical protein